MPPHTICLQKVPHTGIWKGLNAKWSIFCRKIYHAHVNKEGEGVDNCLQLCQKACICRKFSNPTDDLQIGRTQTTSQNIFTLTGGGTETVQETPMIMVSFGIQHLVLFEFSVCLQTRFCFIY